MSGDSPNTFSNEHVFDFRDGRTSPAPTTSKDTTTSTTTTTTTGGSGGGGGVVHASVLVESTNKEKGNDGKEATGELKDRNDDEDKPDFSSPINNNPKKDDRRGTDAEKTDSNKDRDRDGGGGGGGGRKDEMTLLNGEGGKDDTYVSPKNLEDEEDDTCIVNCIYYTMECCRCTIM